MKWKASIAVAISTFLTMGSLAPAAIQSPSTDALSFAAGGRDAGGHFLGGTELNALTSFNGKLYAAIGYWMDKPVLLGGGDPRSSAQVIVLDRKDGRWRQEQAFDAKAQDGSFRFHRASAMQVIRFRHFDARGVVTGSPTTMLAVVLDSPEGALFTQRMPGQWEDTHAPRSVALRSLVVHFDAALRQDILFAGQGDGQDTGIEHAVYSGIYDTAAPGRIRWNATPEEIGTKARIMSMADCGGVLFAAAKPSIFRRDDRTRMWKLIYTYPVTDPRDLSKGSSGFRGLTCIDGPGRKHTLLSGFEGTAGDILRIDPDNGTAATELHTRRFLNDSWGAGTTRRDLIAGYSDAPLIGSGPETRAFGLLAISPVRGHENSAWFLTRTAGNPPTYRVHEVAALPWPNARSDKKLWSIRAIAVSPFPEDKDQVLYLGGYDGHFQPVHNTAWIYRVGVPTSPGR